MKFSRLNKFNTAKLRPSLSVFALLAAMSLPASAGIINEPDPSLGGKVATNIKTGVRYWIELDRHGKVFRVTNQQKFVTGDRIRFHVQATVDGFAYIVLRSGSQGEQAVLFPLERLKEDNRLHREVDYALPADDFLTFDEHPGTEKVTLLFSKHALDQTKLLAASNDSANHVVVGSSAPGSKDLIPARTSVVYQPSESISTTFDDSKTSVTDAIVQAIAQADSSGDSKVKSKGKTDKPEAKPSESASKPTDATATVASKPPADSAPVGAPVQQSAPPEPPVTVAKVDDSALAKKMDAKTESKSETKTKDDLVSKISATDVQGVKSTTGAVLVRQDDPDKVLHIDVDLEHSGT